MTHELTIDFLYDTHRLLVFNRIHQFVPDYHTCEDLTQETFIRAWLALASLKSVKNVRGWLYTIASNIARDFLRSYAHKRASLDITLEDWQTFEVTPDCQETYLIHEQVQSTYAAMGKKDSRVMFLYDVCGYSSDEIAQAIGKDRKHVLFLAAHARESFRNQYKKFA